MQEAIEIENAGLKVELPNDIKYSEELIEAFDADPDFNLPSTAFRPGDNAVTSCISSMPNKPKLAPHELIDVGK